MPTVTFSDFSNEPGARPDWNLTPLHSVTYTTDAEFANLVNGFTPIAGNPTDIDFGLVTQQEAVIKYDDEDWNKLKNLEVSYEDGETIITRNIVHVNVYTNTIDTSAGQYNVIKLENVKRGEIITSNGDDKIHLTLYGYDGWLHQFSIESGNGNDLITLDNGFLVNGVYAEQNPYDGHKHTVFINALDGDNTVILNGSALGDNTGAGDFGSENRVQSLFGQDLIVGGFGKDIIASGGGSDTVAGGDGNDFLFGGTGNDLLRGDYNDPYGVSGTGNGTDVIVGASDCDFIGGKNGADLLFGDNFIKVSSLDGDFVNSLSAAQKATLNDLQAQTKDAFSDQTVQVTGKLYSFGANFFDTRVAITGIGEDRIWGDNGADTIFGGGQSDTIWGGNGTDLINGDGNNAVEPGNDLLYGGAASDTIWGGKGADTLFGGTADDDLHGQDGDDRLVGGSDSSFYNSNTMTYAGGDTLTGGAGADTFVIDKLANIEVVTDFQVGIDEVEVADFDLGDMNGLGTSTVFFFNGVDKAFLAASDGHLWAAGDFAFI